jgi:hypothetical protein
MGFSSSARRRALVPEKHALHGRSSLGAREFLGVGLPTLGSSRGWLCDAAYGGTLSSASSIVKSQFRLRGDRRGESLGDDHGT